MHDDTGRCEESVDERAGRASSSVCPDRLVDRLKQGDSVAAYQLHQLFAPRMLQFLRPRINPVLHRRMDAEDVMQSAFRSFFRVVASDNWQTDGRAERIWSLLYAITLNKLKGKVRFHSAAKRAFDREEHSVSRLSVSDLQHAELVLLDEFERVIRVIPPQHQAILEQMLQGVPESDVAESNGCSVRTVYRVMERVIAELQNQLGH